MAYWLQDASWPIRGHSGTQSTPLPAGPLAGPPAATARETLCPKTSLGPEAGDSDYEHWLISIVKQQELLVH